MYKLVLLNCSLLLFTIFPPSECPPPVIPFTDETVLRPVELPPEVDPVELEADVDPPGVPELNGVAPADPDVGGDAFAMREP